MYPRTGVGQHTKSRAEREARRRKRPRQLHSMVSEISRTVFTYKAASLPGVPTEIRQKIFSFALSTEAGEYQELGVTAFQPFDRPVVHIHLDGDLQRQQRYTPKVDSFWGREPMTRLMRVNRQFYEETFDLIYSSFAFYLVPYSTEPNPQHWHDWLYDLNPHAIKMIRHFALGVTLIRCPRDTPERTTPFTAKVNYVDQLRDNFPNLISMTLQFWADDDLFQDNDDIEDSEWIEIVQGHSEYWRNARVRPSVTGHPTCAVKARNIIAEAQKLDGQTQTMASVYDQGINQSLMEQ